MSRRPRSPRNNLTADENREPSNNARDNILSLALAFAATDALLTGVGLSAAFASSPAHRLAESLATCCRAMSSIMRRCSGAVCSGIGSSRLVDCDLAILADRTVSSLDHPPVAIRRKT